MALVVKILRNRKPFFSGYGNAQFLSRRERTTSVSISSLMIDLPKWIVAVAAARLGALLYCRSFTENEKKRPEEYVGHICARCRRGFKKEDLSPVWQFPAALLHVWIGERMMPGSNGGTFSSTGGFGSDRRTTDIVDAANGA